MSRLHVAVDARFAVLDERGIGRYARSLIAQLLHDPGLRLTFVAPGLLAPRGRIAKTLDVPSAAVTTKVPADADVLWSPSNGTDLETNAVCVTTVHDVVPFVFAQEGLKAREREQAPLRRTAARAKTILADSHYMAGEIALRLGFPRERITVAPLGVGAPFVAEGERARLDDGSAYILHVGAHDMRKNVRTLIDAWQAAFPTADVTLAFTRKPPELPPGAVVLDAPTDERLAAYYRGAMLVAVPSLDEGFGLPLLEALACGAPAIASRVAALPEVGGDATAWIDNPDDTTLWAYALRRLHRNPQERAELAARGPAQAAHFTWERCAAITAAAFRAAVAP